MISWCYMKITAPLFRFFSEIEVWTRTHPLAPVFPLTWMLLCSLISTGPKWFILAMLRVFYLLLFASLLAPAWIQIGWFYFTSENMRRNVQYGDNPRNYLDIYFPNSALHNRKCPVVIYLTGGAWIIGYKAWGTLIARELIHFNTICVTPDYRNYPQGDITDMVTDVNQAISWVFNHIEKFGGDVNNIYLVGQSAGAQLSTVVMLRQFEVADEESRISRFGWSCMKLKGFVGLSGPYDIHSMQNHFHHCGLHRYMLEKIFGDQIADYSPFSLVLKYAHNYDHKKQKLPPCWFFHGKMDTSVPSSSTVDFSTALARGFDTTVKCKIYAEKTHTDPIVEDLLYIGKVYTEEEHFMSDLVDIINGLEDIEDPRQRRDNRVSIQSEQRSRYSFRGLVSSYPSCSSDLMCLVHPRLFRIAKRLNPF
eukprot:TRINITY_DN9735_c0_g1_i1.p1 TRINITY_DN9735_c0_g1~~TRINITY_DN9735_c0_g1_i1.p1  ORF type:complete len:421 (+),score=38.97 TRINITY_DN9735_c0_g1_i1:107-1369(+)